MTRTIYEWGVETRENDGDVIETIFYHDLSYALFPTQNEYLVLVKDTFDDWDLIDRQWAYVENGVLPEFFEDVSQRQGDKIPLKFHDEFNKWKSNQ